MLALDHLVIASANPEEDAQQFVEEHGVLVIEGGKHEEWGTYNFLSYFKNNCYIEWIGVFDEDLAKNSHNPLIQQTVQALEDGDGEPKLITYALRTQNMDHYIRHFESNHFDYQGPFPGSRTKADGSTLSWSMLFPEEATSLPFLIEWGSGVNLPVDETKINPNELITIEVPDEEEVYQRVFQMEAKNKAFSLENSTLILQGGTELHFKLSGK
jgi:hypothetical protein